MHPSNALRLLMALPWLTLLAACSTTSQLPEGEVLYTGIKAINYLDDNKQLHQRATATATDSSGVITALVTAAERIDEVLNGEATDWSDLKPKTRKQIIREQKARAKADRKAYQLALEPAQTEVDAVLEIAPNNPLFGSAYYRSPLPPFGLLAYNAFAEKEGGFSRWMFKTFAKDPVTISTVNPTTRTKVANNTLHNHGFFRGSVNYQIQPHKHNNRKAKMYYYVRAGQPFRLDSIAYDGFTPHMDSLIRRSRKDSYLVSGEVFSTFNLSSEQARLETLFRNQGMYYYKGSYATFLADTVQKPEKVQLIMLQQDHLPEMVLQPMSIGRTNITIYRNAQDTLGTTTTNGSYTFNYSGRKQPLYPMVWTQNIAHRQGRLYRQRDEERTQEMLSELGVFSQYNVSYTRRDSTDTCDTLDVNIIAVLDQPYTASLEMNVTEKNGDRIGPGLTLNLQKKNAFRGADLLSLKLFGSYEWRTQHEQRKESGLFNSYELGAELSLDMPRILFPGISRRRFAFPTATSLSLEADILNRAGYYRLFSSSMQVAYSWHKTRTSRHEFIPFSLKFDKLINSTVEFDSIMRQNPALGVSMRDRFVPAIQYTYYYTQSARRHRNPFAWQFSVKEAGNVVSALYALNGQAFDKQDKQLFSNPFAQFLKVTSELHNNWKINRNLKVVTRLFGGVAYAYGNSSVIPYSDQFYSGGANSVRAFTIRSIGPGRYYTKRSKYSYMDQTGDLTFEANAELRFPMFGGLNGALFLDAGNVWLLRRDPQRPGSQFSGRDFLNDLALGTGFGLRYDMDFLVLRLDLGVALHDPADNGRSGYYNIGKFSDGLALHFAIGYPF